MIFDDKLYHALKAGLVGLSKSEQRALQAIWKYPGVPVQMLPEKIGQKRGGGIWLIIGNRIAKNKLWKRVPKHFRSANKARGYHPFYSGVIVRLTSVVDKNGKRFTCFDLHDEAVKALQDLEIISGNRRLRSSGYKKLSDDGIAVFRNLPAEKKKVLRSIIARRGQNNFRNELIQVYEGACAVTGCMELPILEAAHIHQLAKRGRYEVGNGLLLRADWHTLFDLGMWAIHPRTGQIRLSSKISGRDYTKFNGRRISIPRDPKHAPKQPVLKKRYQSFERQQRHEDN